jgi:hypothetical protein
VRFVLYFSLIASLTAAAALLSQAVRRKDV